MRATLPKRQIATENGDATFRKRFGRGNQQRRPAVCTCAVRQYQSITIRDHRAVQKSADRRVASDVDDWFDFGLLHRRILSSPW
jgi:hypothetical protein